MPEQREITRGDIVLPHDSQLLYVVLSWSPRGFFHASANQGDDLIVHRKLEPEEVAVVGKLTAEQFERLGYASFVR